MARDEMSGAWKHRYFRQAVEILRGDLRTPPDYYSIIAAAVLGGTVLDHTRLEAAYPRVFAAVWEQIEMRRLTCSVCGKRLERGAKMPLITDRRWDESNYTYRHHGRHLDTELRRVFVPNGSGTGVYPDAATLSTESRGAKRGRRS
jgi:hypothetical protein